MWLNPPIWLGKKNDHIPMFTHPACSGYCQYFDMTVDRIFERVNVLGAEVHRLNLALSRSAGAAETVRSSAREDLPVQGQIVEEARQPGGCRACKILQVWSWMREKYGKLWYLWYGYESIPINTIFSGMNIHLPAILGFTRYQGFDPSPYVLLMDCWF